MNRFDATGRGALWINGQLGAADLTTSPQAQQPQQKRSIDALPKPVNSVCYRQTRWFKRSAADGPWPLEAAYSLGSCTLSIISRHSAESAAF